MKTSLQKLKLLYLMRFLLDESDEEHPLSIGDMIDKLSAAGIKAERKSIYDDVECLKLFGLDICTVKSKTYGYYIGERDFELPELKLLVDTVQSSKFLTVKKSRELISKIEKLTSSANAKKLERQVFVANRVKTFNEHIYYNVDKIHEAIAADKNITFHYFEIDINKQKVYRKNGEKYLESPVALTWDDENYYLITYKEKYKAYAHYRVDKMDNISITDDNRILPDVKFDPSAYSKSVFSMFGGEEVSVTIRFDNSLAGVATDRFGHEVPFIKESADSFTVTVKVSVSPQFFSWIMSFGNKVKILSPDYVVEKQKNLLEEIIKNYDN